MTAETDCSGSRAPGSGVETSTLDSGSERDREADRPEGEDEVFVFPATPAQRRFWLLDRLEPGNTSLNVPLALRITGPLQVSALEAAVNEVVARHESLRTTFAERGGEPVQVIAPHLQVPLTVTDLTDLPEPLRAQRAEELVREEARHAFSLEEGPLLHTGVLRLSETEHILLLTVHHAVCDGWSNGVLVREVGTLYSAFSRGLPSPLEELPLQYADYAAWQAEVLQSAQFQGQRAFWRELLRPPLPVLDLPADFPRRGGRAPEGEIATLLLPDELTQALRATASAADATLFMLFAAAFQVVLARYTGAVGQRDFLLGAPMANRGAVELEGLIGLFSNPIILRADLTGDPPFSELLARTRQTCLDAFGHQEVPFEQVLEDLELSPDRARVPLLQVYFIFQRAFMQPMVLPEGELTPRRSVSPGAMFELTLGILERQEGVRLQLEYNPTLFHAATAERMLAHVRNVLELISRRPQARLGELTFLSPAERAAWLAPAQGVPLPTGSPDPGLDALLAGELSRFPARPAVEIRGVQGCADGMLTCGELLARAENLANRLRAVGVQPGDRVAMRDMAPPDVPVVLLAAARTGVLVVPAEHWGECAVVRRDGESLCVEPSPGSPAGASDGNSRVLPGPASPCWVVPCGTGEAERGTRLAVLTQGALVARARAVAAQYRLDAGDRVLLADATARYESGTGLLEGLLAALLAGAVAVLSDLPPSSTSGAGCRVWELGYSSLHGLMVRLEQGQEVAAGLQTVSALHGGKLLAESAARVRWTDCAPGIRLVTGVAVPEAGVCFAPEDAAEGAGTPRSGAGRGAPGCLVADAWGCLAPAGVRGTVWLGGTTLADGYLDEPDATRTSFLGASWDPEGRYFRSGFVGRLQPAAPGTTQAPAVCWLGDAGDALALCGFRVFPLEIATVIEGLPGVAAATVESRPGSVDESGLVARVVPQPGYELEPHELRAQLRAALPPYMVPPVFQVLPAGETLEAGARIEAAAAAVRRAPRDEVEHQLARLWREVLGVPEVGLDDDFFALGGHSLPAIRLCARIEAELGRRLTAATLLSAPTLVELAGIVRGNELSTRPPTVVPLHPEGRRRPLFLFHRDDGLVMCYRELAQLVGADQPVLGIEPWEVEAQIRPEMPLPEMARLYMQDVIAADPTGPYLLGGSSFGGVLAYEVAQQLRAAGRPVAAVFLLDTIAPSALRDELRNQAALPLQQRLPRHLAALRELDTRGRLQYLARKLLKRALSVGPQTRSEHVSLREKELPEAFIRVQDACLAAYRAYEPRPYAGRVVLIRAEERDLFGEYDPELWWGRVGLENLEVRPSPGDHLSMLRPPHVAALAATLASCLPRQ